MHSLRRLLPLLLLLSVPNLASPAPPDEELRALHERTLRAARQLDRLEGGLDEGETDGRIRELDHLLVRLATLADELSGPGADSLHARLRHLRGRLLRLEAAGPPPLDRDASRGRLYGPGLRSFGPVSRATTPPADECALAPTLGPGFHEATIQVPQLTRDGSASCTWDDEMVDAWYRYTAPSAGWIQIRATPGYDTWTSFHAGCPGTSANELACSRQYPYDPPVGVELEAGETVWIRLAWEGYLSEVELTIDLGPATGIEGRIVDLDGIPIEDAGVSAESTVDGSGGDTGADEDGVYRILGLAPGSYVVRAGASGRVPETWDDHPCVSFYGDCTGNETVEVGAGQLVRGIDFDLGPGATLRGEVTKASNGRPVDDAVIEILSPEGELVARDYLCCSGDDASWEIRTLPPGELRARVLASLPTGTQAILWDGIPCPDEDCDPSEGAPIEVDHGAEISGIDFVIDDSSTCLEDDLTICVDGRPYEPRFRVTTHVESGLGGGLDFDATAIDLGYVGVDAGGLFSFFDQTNPEILVKVLDGCALNGHFWVFYAAATSLGFDLRVEDTLTGNEKTYVNPDQTPAATVTDTLALPCL